MPTRTANPVIVYDEAGRVVDARGLIGGYCAEYVPLGDSVELPSKLPPETM